MIPGVLGRVGPWTEEEYLALGETPERVELFDGSLYVSSSSTPCHQHVSFRLARALQRAAEPALRWHVLTAVNVRLRPNRILIPDLVITGNIDLDELVIDVRAIRLVCEISLPTTAAMDQVLKLHYYATARIPWYLVDPEAGTLRLHRLDDTQYVEHATAKPGEVLRLTDPVIAEVDPADLLPSGVRRSTDPHAR